MEFKYFQFDEKQILEFLIKDGLITIDDIVYLSGSVVESTVNLKYSGMGNEESDLDIFIIRKDDNFDIDDNGGYKHRHKITVFKKYFDIQCDIEIYRFSDVCELLNNLNKIQFSEQVRTPNLLPRPVGWNQRDVKSFINRLNYSIVIQNEQQYQLLQNKCNLAAYSKYSMQLIINEIDSLIADIWGNLKPETYDVALYLTRNAFIKLLEFMLYSDYQTVDRTKWIIFKGLICVSDNEEYLGLYNELFKGEVSNFKTCKKIIIKSVDLINEYIQDMDIMEL